MSSILLAIATMCGNNDVYSMACQKQMILCVRDKMMQSPGGKTRTDEYLWECAVQAADKK